MQTYIYMYYIICVYLYTLSVVELHVTSCHVFLLFLLRSLNSFFVLKFFFIFGFTSAAPTDTTEAKTSYEPATPKQCCILQ